MSPHSYFAQPIVALMCCCLSVFMGVQVGVEVKMWGLRSLGAINWELRPSEKPGREATQVHLWARMLRGSSASNNPAASPDLEFSPFDDIRINKVPPAPPVEAPHRPLSEADPCWPHQPSP